MFTTAESAGSVRSVLDGIHPWDRCNRKPGFNPQPREVLREVLDTSARISATRSIMPSTWKFKVLHADLSAGLTFFHSPELSCS